jgi:type II secretory pathway component PulF
MPTFKYEAMDTSGGEVKDSIDAQSEEEAQQKIRQLGYFVTKIAEVQSGKKKGKGKGGKRKKGCRARNSAHSPGSSRPYKTPACRSCGACASSRAR